MNWKLNPEEAADLERRVLEQLAADAREIGADDPSMPARRALLLLHRRGYSTAELARLCELECAQWLTL